MGHLRQWRCWINIISGVQFFITALCEHHPEIIEMCKERHWEFFSHGIYNTQLNHGLDEAQERAMIRDSMETIYQYTGQACSGYLALALSHSEVTMDLFAEVRSELFGEGSDLYL